MEPVSIEDCISDGATRVLISVRHVDADEIENILNRKFSGRCMNGSIIIKDSITVKNVQPAITSKIVDPNAPFFVSVTYAYREFRPITGEIYVCRVETVDPAKGTIVRYIDTGTASPLMTLTVLARYAGKEGESVPVLLRKKYADNGQPEILGIGEFTES